MSRGRLKGSTYIKTSARDPGKVKLRFEKNFDRGLTDECWEWKGSRSWEDYGGFYCFFRGKFKIFPAHVLSYIYYKGEVPDDLMVLHKCNNTGCVNPNHLYAGTHQDNMRDLREAGTLAGKNNPRFGKHWTSDERRLISERTKEGMRRVKDGQNPDSQLACD